MDRVFSSDRDVDGSAGSGQLDAPKVTVFHGQAVDQQLPYPLQEPDPSGCREGSGENGGGVSQGTLGFVQHETDEDCHVQLLLCRTGLPGTPGSVSGIGQDCMNRRVRTRMPGGVGGRRP